MKQGWQIKRIGEVASIVNGGTPSTSNPKYWDGGIEWLTPKDMGKLTGKYVSFGERTISQEGVDNSSAKILPPYSVILSSRAPIGYVAINTLPMSTNQGCKGLIPSKSITAEYLLYFLLKSTKLLNDLGTGATFKELSGGKLGEILIPVPSISEQQHIVTLLDAEFAKIDVLKANAEKNLQNAKDLFQAALKKELEPKEGWDKKQLGDIAEFKNGLNFGKEHGCRKYHFLGVGDFKENTMVETDKLNYIYQDGIDPDYYLKDNDIVFVRSNGSRHLVGRSMLIKSGNEPSVFSGFCIRCRFISSIVLPQFAMRFFSFDTTKRILTSSGGGCNISNLNQKVLSALKIPFPTSIDEQANIVSRIEQMESHCKTLQANYEKTLSLCDDLKQALLRKAFNGEI